MELDVRDKPDKIDALLVTVVGGGVVFLTGVASLLGSTFFFGDCLVDISGCGLLIGTALVVAGAQGGIIGKRRLSGIEELTLAGGVFFGKWAILTFCSLGVLIPLRVASSLVVLVGVVEVEGLVGAATGKGSVALRPSKIKSPLGCMRALCLRMSSFLFVS